jgi:hypothetical protein
LKRVSPSLAKPRCRKDPAEPKHLVMQIIHKPSSGTSANPKTRNTRHFATYATRILTWTLRESSVFGKRGRIRLFGKFRRFPIALISSPQGQSLQAFLPDRESKQAC